MRYEVLIPQQGLTTEMVTITELKKKVGDHVTEGEEILEMESEKATIPLESPVTGTILEILVSEDDEVAIGDVAVVIDKE